MKNLIYKRIKILLDIKNMGSEKHSLLQLLIKKSDLQTLFFVNLAFLRQRLKVI